MRLEHPLRRFRLAAILLAIVITVGVTGYMVIDGWSLLDSFYMVIITISTVGYTEVHAQGAPGRLLTSGLIVVGVGTMLYGFGVFAETLADNAFGRYRRDRQLQRDLNHLRDHFIICGYGRIGTQVVAEFEERRVPYVVIDQTEEALERIRAEGRLHIEVDASKEVILKQAGIERAKGLVSAVDSDERAVYIVLAARSFNPNLYIVARAGRPDSIRRLELAGATRTISPYVMAGHRMAELAIRPAMVDVLDTLHHGEAGDGGGGEGGGVGAEDRGENVGGGRVAPARAPRRSGRAHTGGNSTRKTSPTPAPQARRLRAPVGARTNREPRRIRGRFAAPDHGRLHRIRGGPPPDRRWLCGQPCGLCLWTADRGACDRGGAGGRAAARRQVCLQRGSPRGRDQPAVGRTGDSRSHRRVDRRSLGPELGRLGGGDPGGGHHRSGGRPDRLAFWRHPHRPRPGRCRRGAAPRNPRRRRRPRGPVRSGAAFGAEPHRRRQHRHRPHALGRGRERARRGRQGPRPLGAAL